MSSFVSLSVSSLLDRFLRRHAVYSAQRRMALSVSSLLDRFLRLLGLGRKNSSNLTFQYPRCWIVSSDISRQITEQRDQGLSVSSLLDRFLRPLAFSDPIDDETLSVSSLLDRFLRRRWDSNNKQARSTLSVSSLLDRFLRPHLVRVAKNGHITFSILAVGSFPQTYSR